MDARQLISVDPEIEGGVPVFKGTRIPVKWLFDHLEEDYSLGEFLEFYPEVSRDVACLLLEMSESAITAS